MATGQHQRGLVTAGRGRRGAGLSPGEWSRLAHHEAGHALVAYLLYGARSLKRVSLVDAGGAPAGRTSTYSPMPVPAACRPDAEPGRGGRRTPVSVDAIVDAQGIVSYAGSAAEELLARDLARVGTPRCEPVLPAAGGWPSDGDAACDRARSDRERLASVARLLGASRGQNEFYVEYWDEARRLLHAHWAALKELAEALHEKHTLAGHRIDALLRAAGLGS